MRIIYIALISILVNACSSGVLPEGGGIYTISTDYFSATTAKQSAYESAIKFCKKQGKSIKVIRSQEIPFNKWDLKFSCE